MLSTALLLAASMVVGQADGGEQQLPTAADYVEFFGFLEGKWETTRSDGQKGTVVCELSPTKNCFVSYATMNGEPFVQATAAYDPEQRSWRRTLIGAKGWIVTIDHKCDKSALTGERKGVTLAGSFRTILPDGSIQQGEATLTVVNKDEWESSFRDEMTVKFRRK